MLLDLRDGIRNSKWLKYLLVTVICIPFALFGVNSYFNGGGPDYAAKVNGEKVSLNAFNSAYQNQRAQLQQAFGGRIPEGFNSVSMIGNQAMDTVITREVVRQSTIDNGLAISDENLASQLFEIEAFTVDGTFDKERYQLQLQSMGVSPAEFENQLKNDLLTQQLRESVIASGFLLKKENLRLTELRDQQRNLASISFDVQEKADSIEVSDADIESYYGQNSEQFNNPEKVKVEFLELKIDDLTSTVEVTDEALRGYYDQNKLQWVAPEKRDASHILLTIDTDASDSEREKKLAEANKIYDRLNSGESFEEMAKEFSDDAGSADNGGSLGEFGEGVMVAAFEEAAFSMTEGELSQPVLSEFGYHIIRLNKITGERGQSFEEVKAEVEEQFREDAADTSFFESSERLSNAAYESNDSLQPAADETGLSIQTSDWIDVNTMDGVGQYRQILAAALSDDVLNNGLNSEVLEVGENHTVVLRTLEHELAKPKPLDEVRDDILGVLQHERATEELTALADNMITELSAGADPAAVAEANAGSFSDTVAVGRSDSEVDSELVRAVFTMPKPNSGASVYRTVTTSTGDLAVAMFNGVAESEPVPDESVAAAAAPASSEFESFVVSLEEEAKVEKNEMLLGGEQGMGGNHGY